MSAYVRDINYAIGLGRIKLQTRRFDERIPSYGSTTLAQTKSQRHSPHVRPTRQCRVTAEQLRRYKGMVRMQISRYDQRSIEL